LLAAAAAEQHKAASIPLHALLESLFPSGYRDNCILLLHREIDRRAKEAGRDEKVHSIILSTDGIRPSRRWHLDLGLLLLPHLAPFGPLFPPPREHSPPLSLPPPPRPTPTLFRSLTELDTTRNHENSLKNRKSNRNTSATRRLCRRTRPASRPTTSSRGSASSARGALDCSRRSSRRRSCRRKRGGIEQEGVWEVSPSPPLFAFFVFIFFLFVF